MMAIMYLPNPTKALEHLHRVTKPSGKCFITTWNATETKSIGETVLQRLQEGISTERPVKFWNPEMEDSEYLISEMQKVGFKECVAERKVVYASYPSGSEGVDLAMELAPVLLSRFIDFRDEEEHERYGMLWREEFEKRQTGQGLRIEMCANIVWGKK
jgi:SAM-dependent methyltransferase